jgi:tetratricopeptide (TPR) repeat protein
VHCVSFTRIAAALTAIALTGTSAVASPAGMALPGTRSSSPPANARSAVSYGDAERPTSRISPVRNPIKYFSAAVSELPINAKKRPGGSPNPVMQPTPQYTDSIALSNPVGAPTPELLISMAQMSERQGNIPQARQHFGQALTMWPGHADVLRAAARMEDRLGELAMAENLYQQAVTAHPHHAGALNDLGLCLARQGKLEASVQVIEQAIHIHPDKPLYRNNAATVLVEMRQDQRALGHLSAVHGGAEANYNLGQLLVERGRASEAAPYFQVAVAHNPQLQEAHAALAKVQGNATAGAVATAAQPPVTPQQPAITPVVAPQPVTPVGAGPQLYYPATARSPEIGASSYVPPGYYPPQGVSPPLNPQVYGNSSPRYLPPVASRPGTVQR